ncbi:MAG: hypothetical protein IPL40_08775 [Proteobacteria bacterium]|nr:hypothetical protein [Pseudomonadota bacterium]
MCAAGQLRCVPLLLAPTPALLSGANPLAGLADHEASAALGCSVGTGPRSRPAAPSLGLALAALAAFAALVRAHRRRRALGRTGDQSRQPG